MEDPEELNLADSVGDRRKAAAALVAAACTIQIGAWFAWWQTAWVYDDQALWHFQWALVTASLAAAAALSAPAEGYALWTLEGVTPVSKHSAVYRLGSADRKRGTPHPREAYSTPGAAKVDVGATPKERLGLAPRAVELLFAEVAQAATASPACEAGRATRTTAMDSTRCRSKQERPKAASRGTTQDLRMFQPLSLIHI